jgi:predicted Zn-dependent protease
MRAAVSLKLEDEEAQKALVRLLFQLGYRDEAVASARAYLGRFPELPAANALYASVLVRTGHAPEGVQYLERAHRLAARGSTGVGSQMIP